MSSIVRCFRASTRPLGAARAFRANSKTSPSLWDLNAGIDYMELKPFTQTPSDDVLVVDVRETDEVVQGNIPSSVNLPLSNLEKALDLHQDDFLKVYGFLKPKREQKMVVYCRSGKRSQTAQQIAKLKGFKMIRNYQGSWLDWVNREAEKINPEDE